MKAAPLALAALLLAACNPASEPAAPAAQAPAQTPAPAPVAPGPVPPPAAAPVADFPPVEPRAPGSPGALPDDRTPISEAPFTPRSAQGAADVLQVYFALIGEKKYAQAWALWGRGGEASGLSRDAFAASFDKYHQYNGLVGAPGRIEGAAGSLYVEVPVQVYGRLKTGEEVHMYGPMRLRRVNDVPGSTPEQRLWRIDDSGVRPVP